MPNLSFLLLLLSAFSSPIIANAQQPVNFFVSPAGSDSNAGTLEKPFVSIAKAKETIRLMPRDQKLGGVTVYLRAGIYEAPQVFRREDGGDAQVSVTYAAYGREEVALSGGVTVGSPADKWEALGHDKWSIPIPAELRKAGSFRQLYRDGVRLSRARFPAGDSLLTIATMSPDYKVITLKQMPKLHRLHGERTEVVVLTNWNEERVLLDSAVGNKLYLHDPAGWVGHCCCVAREGMPVYLENAAEFVDAPGSWYPDEKKGVLLYQAAPGEDPRTENFMAPLVQKLLRVEGTVGHPVINLHFKGIGFCYAAFPLPDSGYRGLQAGHYGYQYLKPPVFMEPSAVDFSYAEYCSLENCAVFHVGAGGVGVGEGCRHMEVAATHVYDAGGNGISVGQRNGPLKQHNADWDRPAQAPDNITIYNNYVHDCAATQFGDVGIYAAYCSNTLISHNTVTHLPYTGISIGFIWDPKYTTQKNCIVAFNDVHDVMRLLADGGAIYTLGWEPGSAIIGNLLYNVHRSSSAFGGAPNNAIFFDECSKYFYVSGNRSWSIEDTSALRYNRCTRNEQSWGANSFKIGKPPADQPASQSDWVGSTLPAELSKPRD